MGYPSVRKDQYTQKAFDNNSHCAMGDTSLYTYANKVGFRTTLTDQPKQQYRTKEAKEFSTCHLGQLKLQLNEMQFLTRNSKKASLVVYIGAGGGMHIPYLSKLFPRLTFHLYDDHFNIKETSNIKIFKRFFTDKDARYYSTYPHLFISDIRRDATDNESVWQDMIYQQRLVKLAKPKMANLKFRSPFPTKKFDTFKYLSGNLYLQAFPKQWTTELRLETDCSSERRYSARNIEEQMFFHNNYLRPALYNYSFNPLDVHDKCFDCTYETYIICEYIRKIKNEEPTQDKVRHLMNSGTRCSDK